MTDRFQPSSRDAAGSRLARAIGAQFAAVLLAVLVVPPIGVVGDTAAKASPPAARTAARG